MTIKLRLLHIVKDNTFSALIQMMCSKYARFRLKTQRLTQVVLNFVVEPIELIKSDLSNFLWNNLSMEH